MAAAGVRRGGLAADAPVAPAAPPHAGGRVALSVVVPAWREARRIGATLERIAAHLAARPWSAEVIVVDDGSDDGTAAEVLARRALLPRLRLLRHAERRGKGAALRSGVLAAHGDALLLCDADLSTPIEELDGLLAALAAGADLVLGSRRVRGARLERDQPLRRRAGGLVLRALAEALLELDVRDPTCGFKLLRRSAARGLARAGRIDGFAFDLEWLALARRRGLAVVELPVRWRDDPRSSVRLRREVPAVLLDLWRIRRSSRRARPARPAPQPRSA